MLKVGDRVLIKKPEDIYEKPIWISRKMDKYDNTYQKIVNIIERFDGVTIFLIENEDRFKFNIKWVHDKFEEHKRRLLSV